MTPATRIVISLAGQNLRVLRGERCLREFAVSTARLGEGFAMNSYRTPTGQFRIAQKIGAGAPRGTIFQARVAVGIWHPQDPPADDLILSRILQLDGLDEANANTLARCIYIHGTNREDMLGVPASHGCVRMGNADVMELFDMVAAGDRVEIHS